MKKQLQNALNNFRGKMNYLGYFEQSQSNAVELVFIPINQQLSMH